MRKLLFVFILCTLVLSACSSSIPKSGKALADFNYTDQDGNAFGLEDLKGKVWVATFIYTHCETECPMMALNMSELQQDVADEGLEDVHFVAFSIDPEVDTPEILKEYGQKFNADFSTWHFLTGYTQEEIEAYGPKNFNTVIKKPEDSDQVIHMVDFYLVNKKGELIKNYNGMEDVPFDQIVKDIKAALKQK
ncbi:SCO family protein [Lederbergia graminis]|uniref:SCO family protein n=1 Tax=Lederbergia graminis TaxID=735518 RepID=A0ABW0LFZ7_9BACI|nr:SCO family protein [Paenibacillus bovis]HLU21091.1 SCO family protein [Bacillaceae bacterium]